MKSLLSLTLIVALCVLPFGNRAPATPQPDEVLIGYACVAVVVLIVGGVAVYVIKEGKSCDDIRRCPECLKIVPKTATKCTTCNSVLPTQQWDYPQYLVIEKSHDLFNWEIVNVITWNLGWDSQVTIKKAASLQEYLDSIPVDPTGYVPPPVVLSTNSIAGKAMTFVRSVEQY